MPRLSRLHPDPAAWKSMDDTFAKVVRERNALLAALKGVMALDLWKHTCDVPGCCTDVYVALEDASDAIDVAEGNTPARRADRWRDLAIAKAEEK